MSNESDHLIREVREELRRDQLKKIWRDYGTYIIAGVALLLASIGGYNWWQAKRVATAEAAGASFAQAIGLAIDDKKSADAEKLLTTITRSGAPGYTTLAHLTLAGEAIEAGRTDDAIKAYEAAATATSEKLLKDYATLQAAALKIDSADWTEMQNRLKDLAADSSPWRYAARELMGLSALRAGKLPEARLTLAPLSADLKVPQGLRERASALMALVVAAESEKTAPQSVELEPAEGPPPAKPAAPAVAPLAQPAPASGPADAGTTDSGAANPGSLLDRLKGGR